MFGKILLKVCIGIVFRGIEKIFPKSRYLYRMILEISKLGDFANSRNFVALKNILGIYYIFFVSSKLEILKINLNIELRRNFEI